MGKTDLHLAYKRDSGHIRDNAIVYDIGSIIKILNDNIEMEKGYESHVAVDPEYLEWLEEKTEKCLNTKS